jgi:hypothetical protein
MGLNQIIVDLTLKTMKSGDTNLYDAVAEYDKRTVCGLINKVYFNEVKRMNYIKEPVDMAKIIQDVDAALGKMIKIRMC